MNEETKRSCVDCGVYNCHTRDKEYPDFCLTTELTDEERESGSVEAVRGAGESESVGGIRSD